MGDAGAGGSIPPNSAEKQSTARTPEARDCAGGKIFGNRGISGQGMNTG
jgi:hypothetical protein